MSSELTFITNEQGKNLSDRFSVLLGDNTRFFDCLVGYFFISGFHKLYRALTQTEKIRILIGIKTDRGHVSACRVQEIEVSGGSGPERPQSPRRIRRRVSFGCGLASARPTCRRCWCMRSTCLRRGFGRQAA
jgi:hypothetical protein